MLGEDECADADEHYQGREDDAPFVGSKDGAFVNIFRDAALRHEDGVVVALTEDEGGEDDVDDVELDAQQRHDAQNPYPADSHRDEGYDGQLDASER